jgi:hypothetical protein
MGLKIDSSNPTTSTRNYVYPEANYQTNSDININSKEYSTMVCSSTSALDLYSTCYIIDYNLPSSGLDSTADYWAQLDANSRRHQSRCFAYFCASASVSITREHRTGNSNGFGPTHPSSRCIAKMWSWSSQVSRWYLLRSSTAVQYWRRLCGSVSADV